MIEQKTFYTLKCDQCGNLLSDYEQGEYNERVEFTYDEALECDWKIDNTPDNKDLCPNCWEIDDHDNIIIKPKP